MTKRLLCAVAALFLCFFALSCAARKPSVFADESAFAHNAPHETREVLILMYHSILKDASRANRYVLSPDTLESDIRYLLDAGYETVVMGDLIRFVRGVGDLPEKPVVLTFDDGHLNNLTYVLPLLVAYDCRAVISIVGAYAQRFTDAPDPNPNYAYLSWDEIRQLYLSDRFEIQNHSYDMHGQSGRMGSSRMRGESEESYARAFCEDTARTQQELTSRVGVTPTTYTYPFGQIGENSRALLIEMGFSASLSCREGVSTLVVGDAGCLFSLCRYNRPSGKTSEAFFAEILA